METNNRHNRQRFGDDYRDNQSHHYRRVDEDAYRGAYRFDTNSDHSNETTYDGFDLNDSMSQRNDHGNFRRAENNQGGDYIYRRSKNTLDNDRRYSPSPQNSAYDRNHRGGQDYNSRYDDRFGRGSGNFNNDYGPDPFRSQHRDQNYGNMAGSLSFGYDGDYNSDPDYRRRYDPMSGRIRQSESGNRRHHPDKYGPPDRFGINPDYDRY